MTHFRHTFMGINGFEEMKRYTRSGTDFGREIVAALSERIQLEQMYSKSLRRLGQKISKASCLIISSPLSSAWNTVGLEMEKEADIHKDFCADLHERCIRPLSTLTEAQLKPRKIAEQRVESSFKVWNEKYADHVKLKKRMHVQRRENEMLIEQIDGPRTKTEKEQQKLVNKQARSEDVIRKTDGDYYNSLMTLERSRQEWELNSFQCCDDIENMEDNKYREICHVIRQYSDVMYDLPSKIKKCCRIIDEAVDEKRLSPSKEISVVAEKCKGADYYSEQILCDYYQENFNFPMQVNRRKQSLRRLLEKYLNDYQKETIHKDGLKRIEEQSMTSEGLNIQNKLLQSTATLNYLDVIRFKLNKTLATIDGSSSKPTHLFEKSVEEVTDRQGIKFSVLKTRPGDDLEKLKERNRRKSKSSYNDSNKYKNYSTISAAGSSNVVESSGRRSSRNQQVATVRANRNKSKQLVNLSDNNSTSSSGHSSSQKSHKDPPPSYENIDKEGKSLASASNDDVTENRNVICQCVAIYDYSATQQDELTISVDDVIEVYEKGEDDWWRGARVDQGKVGLFPANYVQILNDDENFV